MDYPEDFETSAFPAGKRIAVSRTAGIWIFVSFLLILFCCVAIPWIIQNRTIEPFIIYVDGANGKWELLGQQKIRQPVPYYTSMQRALVGVFTERWFTLSDNPEMNEARWNTCNRETVCANRVETTLRRNMECNIFCLAEENLYRSFADDVVPLYQSFAALGERWYVNPSRIIVTPNGNITKDGGNWIARARVRSSIHGDFQIIAYIRIERDVKLYPQTLGYYVADFNAYREQ
ncbi:MAG: hypothetical protein J5742_03490 [Alphaproteobacteria bacterium]|nr:hypothetical protein [Alphaproteobacteria bacterium]